MEVILNLIIVLAIGIIVIGVYGFVEIGKLKCNIKYWLILAWVSGMGIVILINMIKLINQKVL